MTTRRCFRTGRVRTNSIGSHPVRRARAKVGRKAVRRPAWCATGAVFGGWASPPEPTPANRSAAPGVPDRTRRTGCPPGLRTGSAAFGNRQFIVRSPVLMSLGGVAQGNPPPSSSKEGSPEIDASLSSLSAGGGDGRRGGVSTFPRNFVEYRSEDSVERSEVAVPLHEADTSHPVQRRARIQWDDVHGPHQCAHAGEPDRDPAPCSRTERDTAKAARSPPATPRGARGV